MCVTVAFGNRALGPDLGNEGESKGCIRPGPLRRSFRVWLRSAFAERDIFWRRSGSSASPFPYASGFAAFSRPAYSLAGPSLPALGIPVVRFPGLAVPKLHPAAAVPAAAAEDEGPGARLAAGSRTVPVITDTTPSPLGNVGHREDEHAGRSVREAPVVQDTVGMPSTFGTPPAAPAAPAAATPTRRHRRPVPRTPAGADDACSGVDARAVQGRSLQSAADEPPATTEDDTISSSDPPQVEAPPVGPVTSGDRYGHGRVGTQTSRRLRRSTLRSPGVTTPSRR